MECPFHILVCSFIFITILKSWPPSTHRGSNHLQTLQALGLLGGYVDDFNQGRLPAGTLANNKRILLPEAQLYVNQSASCTQAMLQFRHLPSALLAASVFGVLTAYADTGVLSAGQTLSQVCMSCRSIRVTGARGRHSWAHPPHYACGI